MFQLRPSRGPRRLPDPPASAVILGELWRRAFRPNPLGWSSGFIASDAFLQTQEWSLLRYQALRANDGRCELCGRGKHQGVWLNVDHVKLRRTHPHLALSLSNLQVLCNEDNRAKGNWDATDWRHLTHPHRPNWRRRLARYRATLARWW